MTLVLRKNNVSVFDLTGNMKKIEVKYGKFGSKWRPKGGSSHISAISQAIINSTDF